MGNIILIKYRRHNLKKSLILHDHNSHTPRGGRQFCRFLSTFVLLFASLSILSCHGTEDLAIPTNPESTDEINWEKPIPRSSDQVMDLPLQPKVEADWQEGNDLVAIESDRPLPKEIPSLAADLMGPNVTATNPAHGEHNIAVYDRITQNSGLKFIAIRFSEAIDASTLKSDSLILTPSALVENIEVLDEYTIRFIIKGTLKSKQPYQAWLNHTAIQDLAGNAMTSDYIWAFQTIECGPHQGQSPCAQGSGTPGSIIGGATQDVIVAHQPSTIDKIVSPPYCGNNVIEAKEECDDGNKINGDGCENDCTIGMITNLGYTQLCGNGEIDPGETCDPPGTQLHGDYECSLDCQHVYTGTAECGNGVIEPGEMCDPPNGSNCMPNCHLAFSSNAHNNYGQDFSHVMKLRHVYQSQCGNSILEVGEACDDGNAVNNDGCSALCQLE